MGARHSVNDAIQGRIQLFSEEGGFKFDKKIFYCKGVEEPAPQKFLMAFSCNLKHIGHCFSLSISPNHKKTPE